MLALLVALSLSQVTPDSRVTRVERVPGGRTVGSRTSGGGTVQVRMFPQSNAGTSGACSVTAPVTVSGQALSFARASVAECYSNDGQTLTQLAVDKPVVSSGVVTSSWLGLWVEPSRDNELWPSRDFSNANWIKTNMTCVKTATGMRNDANGASTCTATAANGTVCRTVTRAAATATTSGHIKRRTGTGALTIARDGATYGANLAGSLSTTLWRRAVPKETPGCAGGNCLIDSALTSSVLNPTICIKLATSGDAVDLDFWQDELGDEATSPIETTTTWVNRALTVADLPAVSSPTASTGFSLAATQVSSSGSFTAGGTAVPLVLGAGTLGSTTAPSPYVWMYTPSAAGRIANDTSGVVSAGTASYDPFYSSFSTYEVRNVAYHTGSAINACQEGECAVGSASTLGTPAFTRILIGRYSAAVANHASAVVKDICYDPSQKCVPAAQTGPIAWIGDSIVRGVGSLPLTPPKYLTALAGVGIVNGGVGSNTIAACGSRYNSTYAAAGYRTIIWSCGVNDMAAGTAGATAATAAQVYLADARSRGMKVIVTSIMPWKNSAGWTAGKQTETAAYNSAMSTWAGANGAFYVSTASMGGQGGDPDLLLTTLDSGDLIHPNSAGASALATLVNAASP